MLFIVIVCVVLWLLGMMTTSTLGGAPKNAACDAFGRAGIQGLVGGKLGAPPEWIDEGAPADN